jgi:hypothetical protein
MSKPPGWACTGEGRNIYKDLIGKLETERELLANLEADGNVIFELILEDGV